MGSVRELHASRSKTGKAFALIAQDKPAKTFPQKGATIAKLDFDKITDSIFIVRSLLMAIAKEAVFKSPEQETAIAELKQHIVLLQAQNTISDMDFFKINNQFYAVLSRLNGFQRVTDILANEKLNIDRALRLSLGQHGNYGPITKLYVKVLSCIQSSNPETTKRALCDLVNAFDECALAAQANCREF